MMMPKKLKLVFATLGMGLITFTIAQGAVQAISLSNEAPTPANSNPNNAHTFLLRRSSNFGRNPDLRLVAYYPSDTTNGQWQNGVLKFMPGGYIHEPLVCQTRLAGAPADFDKPRYIKVNLAAESGASVNYFIPYGNACNYNGNSDHVNGEGTVNTNQIFASYPLPGNSTPGLDPDTNMYKVVVTVSYNSQLPENVDNTGNTVQFDVKGNTSGMVIGQLGGGESVDDTQDGYSFPLRTDYEFIRNGTAPSGVEVPFGLPCNVTGAARSKRIGLYDADNGSMYFSHTVRYKLKELDENGNFVKYVKFDASTRSRGTLDLNDTRFTPNDGEAAYASIKADIKTQTNYVMEITGVDKGNIIDVHVPGDTIFGTLDCNWRMKVDSWVDGDQGTIDWFLGDAPVTFKHRAQNVGTFKTDDVVTRVFWDNGKTGVQAGPDTKRYERKDQPGSEKIYQNTFTPQASDVGKTICQFLRANPHSLKDSNPIDSSPQACIRVKGPRPPVTDTVNIQPIVDDGPDIEPTETTTLNGRVNVSNFPNYTDWGYTEKSKRLDAQRVTASVTNDGIGSDSRIVYTCPSGYSPSGTSTSPPTCSRTIPGTTTYSCPHGVDTEQTNNCKHFYNGSGNDTKAKCEGNGHIWSSGNCYDTHAKSSSTSSPTTQYASPNSSTQYRYRCEDPTWGAWGAWNGGPPSSCKKEYTCPGGARVSGTTSSSAWRTSTPTCDGWKCQYPSAQINQASQPTCEYRCQAGTGNRAYNNNGSSSSPCYVSPSFSLRCKWDSGETVDATVTGNGIYCTSSVQRQGGAVVGVNVCASLTYNRPSSWSPSDPRPGYGLNAAGTTYGQWKEWGWGNPGSDNGCSRVVAKPTVKINGGDIVAGAAMTQSNGTCNPATAANIVGWPHAPTYDASHSRLGVFSRSTVTGFASAAIAANQSQPPRGLTFANSQPLIGQNYGGDFGNMKCIPDHYGNPSGYPTVPLVSIGNPAYQGSYRGTGGQINASPISMSQHLTVYVSGNVYIKGDVSYQGRGAWTTADQIPAFKLVVSGGNIYIDPDVKKLDGIYVSQPNAAGVGGHIYTCATSTAPYAGSNLYDNCKTNQLVVNGVFIAQKVHLDRTQGTAIFGQTAEQFNYLPELWTAQWPRTINSSADELKYDSILSLPPVL